MTFARWQPAYASHRVALIPCEIVDGNRKKPLVKHPERFGIEGSTEIARKFPNATAGLVVLRRRQERPIRVRLNRRMANVPFHPSQLIT
jgi:hypothetical protein